MAAAVRVLEVVIECGKKSCVSDDNKLCRFAARRLINKTLTCTLFREDLCSDDQRDDNKPQRCASCLQTER